MLLGLATAVLAVVLDERDLVFVAVVALVLPALAWAFTGVRRVTLAVDHLLEPQRLQAGEVGALRVRVRNDDDRPTRPLDLTQPGVPDLLETARRAVDPIPPGESSDVVLPVHARHRGGYTITSPLLRLTDPLGLSQLRRELPASAEVLVLPTVVPLVGLPRGLSGHGTASGSATGLSGGGNPDAGVRAYRIGDDIRTVHWRASARLEEDLVVRVSAPTTLGSAVLVLDHRAAAHVGGADGLEVAVTLGASIGHHLLEQDVEIVVADHAGVELVAGHDVADDLLAVLAVAGDDSTSPPALHPVVPGGPDAVVAVVGRLRESEASALAALRRGTAITFVLEDAAGVRHGSTTAEILRAAGWRVVPVDVADASTSDGGSHLAQAWRAACSAGLARTASGGAGAAADAGTGAGAGARA